MTEPHHSESYAKARLPTGLWVILALAVIAGVVAATFSVKSEQFQRSATNEEVEQNQALLKRIERLENEQTRDVAEHRLNNRSDHLCMFEFITRIVEDVRSSTRRALDEPCPRALPGFDLDQVLTAVQEPAPRIPHGNGPTTTTTAPRSP